MPFAGRKRVEGGPPDSVAIGRNRSQSVAPKQKTRLRKKSRFGVSVAPKQKTRRRKSRNRSRLVAIGRNRSQSVAIGRDWSQSVAIGRDWSRLVAIGRDWSRLVAIGRNRSRLVAIGRDWSRRNRRQGAEKSRNRSRLVAIGRAETKDKAQTQKKARFHNRESGCITSQGVARS